MTDVKTLGNASLLYICPKCGCPDLMGEQSSVVVSAKHRKVMCPNCKWEGSLADAAGVATTEKVYDTKTILNLLLFVVTKHAAGPIAQALTFVGLLEPGDQAGLDKVMRAATEGVIEKAFMAAAEHAAEKAQGQFTKLGEPAVEAEGETIWTEVDDKIKEDKARGIITVDPASGPDFTVVSAVKDGIVVSQEVIERKDPEMTADNVHDFHIITGEYAPGWQERESKTVSLSSRIRNRLWEHHIRDELHSEVMSGRSMEGATIFVPQWVHTLLVELEGPLTLLGCPVEVSESDDYFVEFKEVA